MTPDTLAVLRQAVEAVRTQIPTGGLTRASVERLRPAPRMLLLRRALVNLTVHLAEVP